MNRPPDSNSSSKDPGFERDILLFFWLVFGGMLAFGIIDNFEPAKLGILFYLISWAILLVIHEFGHALMARFLNWRVELISIGFGKVVRKTRIWGMPLEFRSVPISGYVLPVPGDMDSPKTKNFLIYAAGPGIELFLVVLITGLFGWDNVFSRSPELWHIATQAFCLAALVGIITNVVPLVIKDQESGDDQWTDGLGMIRCWQLPMSYYRDRYEEGRKPPSESTARLS